MDIADLKALIEHVGGPDYILGFRFANGYKITYTRKGEIVDPENDLLQIGKTEFIKFKHIDTGGHVAWSYLEVSEIAQVYVLDNLDDQIYTRDILE